MHAEMYRYLVLICSVLLITGSISVVVCDDCLGDTEAECCRSFLLKRPGTFYCTSPEVDLVSQSVANCSPKGLVTVSCFAAPNVTCECGRSSRTYNASQCVFTQQQSCRFVSGRRYDYRVAVGLSLFLGMLGIDRFYLGYPAIGLAKLCTLGFFFIGHLVDFVLILIQAVGPADRSGYYAPFYGPLVTEANTTSTFMADMQQMCV